MCPTVDEHATDLVRVLTQQLGPDAVSTGDEDRQFFSHDIYSPSPELPALVITPATREQAMAAVREATQRGFAVVARGGGSSYTSGFATESPRSVLLDTQRLDRVLEIDEKSMLVRVEAGCTWRALHQELHARGLRTPFWGPFSGRIATVGGTLSQTATAWGATLYGVSSESVLGLEIGLPSGETIQVGADAPPHRFFRYYGPDLTGLFLGDCGALGIKLSATMKLIREPRFTAAAAFHFSEREAMVEAMSEIARSGVASECFGMCPVLQKQRMKRESLAKDVRSLAGLVQGSGGLARGLGQAAKVVASGRRFMKSGHYAVYVIAEGDEQSVADHQLDRARTIALQGGEEAPPSIPRVMRGDPFMITLSNAIGPSGERWVPVHGVLPFGRAPEAWSAITEILDERAEALEKQEIVVGFLTATAGCQNFVLEPVIYWPGPLTPYYKRALEPSFLGRLKTFPPNPDAAAAAAELRGTIARRFVELGAAHFQIGRTYHYWDALPELNKQLLQTIKNELDPHGLINPGVLGLGRPQGAGG